MGVLDHIDDGLSVFAQVEEAVGVHASVAGHIYARILMRPVEQYSVSTKRISPSAR